MGSLAILHGVRGPRSRHVFKRKIECRATLDRALGPDSPTVTSDNALHGHEADAGAFELLGRMQALEHPKQFGYVSHVEAGPIVAQEKGSRCRSRSTNFDFCIGALAREFPGFSKEIAEDDTQQRTVALGFEAVG